MKSKIKVGIVGATGYTGSELVRLLKVHPNVEISVITSESKEGESFSDIHPQFKNIEDRKLESLNSIDKYNLDLVFLALPHGVSMDFVKENINATYKIIDLSADFRLSSEQVYKEWYKEDHKFPEGLKKAVFGSPELFRDRIKGAKLIANPGCYVTSVVLALAPLLKNKIIQPDAIFADCKSGVTGAGAKAKDNTHFPVVNDNFQPYALKTHRHTIEMQEVLDDACNTKTSLLFTPHLLPVDRGIISTIYSIPVKNVTEDELRVLFADFYKNEPFVRVLTKIPSIKNVRGSNYCDIMVNYDKRTNKIFTISALDNLVKGASGQAIQNMNILFGLDEKTGLEYVPLCP